MSVGPKLSLLSDVGLSHVKFALQSIDGKKDLTLDEPMMRHLDRLCGASFLKSLGVDKMYTISLPSTGGDNEQHVYCVRPTMLNVKKISDQINADKSKGCHKKYKILMVPRKLHVAELILEQEGVYGYTTVDELPLDFLQFDDDLLSLQMPEFFRSFFLEEDQTLIHSIASSLCSLQSQFGQFPVVFAQGRCSKIAYDLMNDLYVGPDQQSTEVGYLFLFDRDIDYTSVLLTQMTFQGMLDETFGIKNGVVQFGSDVTGEKNPTKLLLNSKDTLFDEIRDIHMSNVFSLLSHKVKEVQSSYDKRHDMSLSEMKNFVAGELKGLKEKHKSLSLFVGASEVIMNQTKKTDFDEHLRTEHSLVEGVGYRENVSYIEEVINRQYTMLTTLRLLCLLSVTQDGLSSKEYKSLCTQFIQSHGFEHLLTLHNLRKLCLFVETDTTQLPAMRKIAGKVTAAVSSLPWSSNFGALSKKLNLVPKVDSNYDLKHPTNAGYVFSGAYIPVTCRLVEHVLDKKSTVGIDDALKLLPGVNINSRKTSSAGSPPPVVIVYYLGGVTYAEVAALRLLGRMKGYKIIIATTSFITGSSMLSSIREQL